MPKKLDKLGRRIPQFDRSAAVSKGNATKKEKYGTDVHARNGTIGGRSRGRGYFGTLADQGKTDELKALAAKGAEKSNAVQGPKRAKARRRAAKLREVGK